MFGYEAIISGHGSFHINDDTVMILISTKVVPNRQYDYEVAVHITGDVHPICSNSTPGPKILWIFRGVVTPDTKNSVKSLHDRSYSKRRKHSPLLSAEDDLELSVFVVTDVNGLTAVIAQ